MRKISDLVKSRERVWVYLNSDKLAEKFVMQAATEGFHYPDGSIPHHTGGNYLYGIGSDKHIAHLAIFIWNASFKGIFNNEPPFRVDYEKYINVEDVYECNESTFKKISETTKLIVSHNQQLI